MNNSKIKILAIGVLATVVVSSTPVFAATNTGISNGIKTEPTKTITSVSKVSIIPGTMHASFYYGPNGGAGAQSIISSGEFIQQGDEGLAVKQVQTALNNWVSSVGGASSDYIKVDGIFGSGTAYALYVFQDNVNSCGNPDEIVGPNTWAALSHYM